MDVRDIALNVIEIYDATMSGVYVFELKKVANLKGAVVFARQALVTDAAAKGYNVLLTEGYVGYCTPSVRFA